MIKRNYSVIFIKFNLDKEEKVSIDRRRMCDFVEEKCRKKERTVIQRTMEFFVFYERPIFVCSRRNEYQSNWWPMSLFEMMSLQSISFVRSLSFNLCLYRIKKTKTFFFFFEKTEAIHLSILTLANHIYEKYNFVWIHIL